MKTFIELTEIDYTNNQRAEIKHLVNVSYIIHVNPRVNILESMRNADEKTEVCIDCIPCNRLGNGSKPCLIKVKESYEEILKLIEESRV